MQNATVDRFEAVIFDFGGVITSSPFEAFNRMEAERGSDFAVGRAGGQE